MQRRLLENGVPGREAGSPLSASGAADRVADTVTTRYPEIICRSIRSRRHALFSKQAYPCCADCSFALRIPLLDRLRPCLPNCLGYGKRVYVPHHHLLFPFKPRRYVVLPQAAKSLMLPDIPSRFCLQLQHFQTILYSGLLSQTLLQKRR